MCGDPTEKKVFVFFLRYVQIKCVPLLCAMHNPQHISRYVFFQDSFDGGSARGAQALLLTAGKPC